MSTPERRDCLQRRASRARGRMQIRTRGRPRLEGPSSPDLSAARRSPSPVAGFRRPLTCDKAPKIGGGVKHALTVFADRPGFFSLS